MNNMFFFFSSRRRHTRLQGDWSSDVCSSDLGGDGLCDLFIGPLSDAGPTGVDDTVGTEARRDPPEDGRVGGQLIDRLDHLTRRESERVGAMAELGQRLDVWQVGIVAEQVAGAVGN